MNSELRQYGDNNHLPLPLILARLIPNSAFNIPNLFDPFGQGC
jgi:hypothetical protein